MVTLFLSITKRKHKLVLRVNFTNMKVSWSYKGKNGSPKNQLAIDLNLRGVFMYFDQKKIRIIDQNFYICYYKNKNKIIWIFKKN